MALKINFMFSGIEIKDAYVRVSSYSGNKHSLTYLYSVLVNTPETEFVPASQSSVTTLTAIAPVDIEGGNPVKQAYEHLKTLPNMAGAVDC